MGSLWDPTQNPFPAISFTTLKKKFLAAGRWGGVLQTLRVQAVHSPLWGIPKIKKKKPALLDKGLSLRFFVKQKGYIAAHPFITVAIHQCTRCTLGHRAEIGHHDAVRLRRVRHGIHR